MNTTPPNFTNILQAAGRIKDLVNHTPVLTSRSINTITGSELFFKCENFQRVGAFKFRGACNAILNLRQTNKTVKAVATHSSGNHAAALALAAKQNGVECFVVMPNNSPAIKIEAVNGYGAHITFCEPSLEARETTLKQVQEQTGAHFIHPYNHPDIIAGQGIAMLEFSEEIQNPDVIIAPVGGGGLLSGTALAAKHLFKKTTVLGAEPAGADDAARSLKAGHIIPSENPKTMADGLLTSLGDITFLVITEKVDDILTVSEKNIARAMKLLWERMKIIVEPSGCVPLAVILEHQQLFKNKRVSLILSGGNIDLQTAHGILTNSQLTG